MNSPEQQPAQEEKEYTRLALEVEYKLLINIRTHGRA